MLVWTTCRSVWFAKCMKGWGAKVTPGGGVTGGAAGAGGRQSVCMNGRGGGGPGSGGVWGRP